MLKIVSVYIEFLALN